MALARLRFFCRTLPVGLSHYWQSVGLDYLKALAETPYGVRALPMTRGGVELGDEDSPWHPVARLFTTDLDEKYVNIVCGDNGEVQAFFTVGVPNIAITGVTQLEPNFTESKYLLHYDAVIAPTNEDAAGLRKMGINALYVPPLEAELTPLLARFIHA